MEIDPESLVFCGSPGTKLLRYIHESDHEPGWWFFAYPSEKYEFVSWDAEIPNIWKNKFHVPNHQPVNLLLHQFRQRYCITRQIRQQSPVFATYMPLNFPWNFPEGPHKTGATTNQPPLWRTAGQRWCNRNRLIGGTDSIYKAKLFKAYVREYPQKIWPKIW